MVCPDPNKSTEIPITLSSQLPNNTKIAIITRPSSVQPIMSSVRRERCGFFALARWRVGCTETGLNRMVASSKSPSLGVCRGACSRACTGACRSAFSATLASSCTSSRTSRDALAGSCRLFSACCLARRSRIIRRWSSIRFLASHISRSTGDRRSNSSGVRVGPNPAGRRPSAFWL